RPRRRSERRAGGAAAHARGGPAVTRSGAISTRAARDGASAARSFRRSFRRFVRDVRGAGWAFAVVVALGISTVAGLPVREAAAHDNVVVHRRMAEESVSCVANPFYTGATVDVREGSYGED